MANRKKPARKCGECRRSGHTRATCPELKNQRGKTAPNRSKKITDDEHAANIREALGGGIKSYLAGLSDRNQPEDAVVAEALADYGVASLFLNVGFEEGMTLLLQIIIDCKELLDEDEDEDEDDEWDEEDEPEDDGDDGDDDGAELDNQEAWRDAIPDAIRQRLNDRGALIFGG
jgi:hypothetical protein